MTRPAKLPTHWVHGALWGGAFALVAAVGLAQTAVDLRTQSKDVDFGSATSTRSAKTGSVLPSTCNVGEVFFNTAAVAGSNWYGCASSNNWFPEGSGGSSSPALAVLGTSATGSVLTIGASCSSGSPCNVRVGSTVFGFTTTASATVASGSGAAFVYIDNTGALTVGHNLGSGNLTCSGPCVALNGVTAFPPDSTPLWIWTAASGAWIPNSGLDQRAFLSQKVVSCGANLLCANSGTTLTISGLTSGSGGSGLTSPLVDFADHSSAATTSSQTLASLTLPANALATNNDYAILAITGIQTTGGNALSLSFGSAPVTIGLGTPWTLTSGITAFTVECKVIRTASNAQKISCVSGGGQNVAGPYITFTSGTQDLTSSLAISVNATTNGNAGDVVLKTLEFRPVNF